MKTKNMTTLHAGKSIGRLPWAVGVCLTLATLGLGFSANAQARTPTFTTFDAPGAGTGPGQGTFALNINPAGEISGYSQDASNVFHGFVRTPDGAITTFDAPGAGTGPFQGTATTSVDGMNPAGATVGQYLDASNVFHGFVRAPNGTITTFDAPGAGTGAFQGTVVNGINPAGVMEG